MIMKVFTFAGYTKHLEELDFDYVVIDKTFNDLTPELEEKFRDKIIWNETNSCLLYTSPSPRDGLLSRMPSSA